MSITPSNVRASDIYGPRDERPSNTTPTREFCEQYIGKARSIVLQCCSITTADISPIVVDELTAMLASWMREADAAWTHKLCWIDRAKWLEGKLANQKS